ncbi:MAG TPA: hypothetical protein VGI93_20895 [Steroidobacteraceae bacterium]|jgi:probable HAF family extracellular repeat protein
MPKLGDVSGIDVLRLSLGLKVAAAAMGLGFANVALAANPPQYNLTDLGTLGGNYSYANGINASGQVTGASTLYQNQATHAFIYTPGNVGIMKDLGSGGGTAGTGINASGQVSASDGGSFPWLYSNGAWIDLDPASYGGPLKESTTADMSPAPLRALPSTTTARCTIYLAFTGRRQPMRSTIPT